MHQVKVQGQGFFICHIINYTGYNQKWNVEPSTCPYIHNIYDKGIDKTGIEEKYSITWGRWGEKKLSPDYAPWRVQCENRKNTSATSTYTIDTRLCNRGSNPAPASSHPVLQPFRALVTDPLVRLAVQSNGGEGSGVGRWMHIFMCVYV